MDNKPLIAILGPTGSGKSQLAMALAEDCKGEIISCDSVQVYRGFDIGSAKPAAAERARVPHHLVDICDWSEPFDAQQFRTRAREAIEDCRARGKRPILCGGTGLYLRLLRWGLVDSPGADPALREALHQREAEQPGSLAADLVAIDPEAATLVDLKNLRRVVRSLEIYQLSGKTPSGIRAEHGFRHEEIPMRVLMLDWETSLLRSRVRSRLEEMLDAGWLEEVTQLLQSGVSRECPAMSAVGYREVASLVAGEINADQLPALVEKSTWSYARRQRTWMRKEKDVRRYELQAPHELGPLIEALVEEQRPGGYDPGP